VKLNASDCRKEQIARSTASAMMQVLIVKLQFWVASSKEFDGCRFCDANEKYSIASDMPTFLVKFKAELEGIKQLIPISNNEWRLDIRSSDNDVDVRKDITVSGSDVIALEGSRGEAHFVMKWPGSKHQSYMKIIDVKNVTGRYASEDSGKWLTILGLECRGIVPTRWIPGSDFIVESDGGHYFESVDLSDRDWADYDEDNDLSVSITNVECKIE
jgi:hypothetical protein